MSSFLDLCRDAARESGVSGLGQMTSVQNQVGRQAKIVYWTAEAWRLIQLYRDWNFMRREYEGSLVPGTKRYTGVSFGAPDLSRFLVDTPANRPHSVYDAQAGIEHGEWPLRQVSWETWRHRYQRGPQSSGRPQEYALSPQGEIAIGPTPDQPYVIRGEYWRQVQVLSAGTDIPMMPADYHQIIAWRAVMLLQEHDEAFEAIRIGQARTQYQAYLERMLQDQLPTVSIQYPKIA